MSEHLKRTTLAFLLLAVIVTVLLAAALPQLDLKPGSALPFQARFSEQYQTEQTPQVRISISTYLKAILWSILVVLIGYLIYKSRQNIPLKDILLPALIVAILTMVALYILFVIFNVGVNLDFSAPEIVPPAVNMTAPQLGPLPPGLLWLIWGGLALLFLLLGIWIIRWRTRPASPIDPLGLQAQQAILALRSGSDLADVIVNCYIQMSQVLKQEQKLELEQTMTAREFERLLAARGFPPAPVRQLTGLFEDIRYGHRRPGPAQHQQALDSLHAIVQHSHLNRGTE